MTLLKIGCCCWLALASFACLALCAGPPEGAGELATIATNAAERPRLFRMLDFGKFKLLFNKSYHSWTEELARARLFLAKCLAAFVSALNYKQGTASSYQSINQMSDWTRDEWRATLMNNAELRRQRRAGAPAGSASEQLAGGGERAASVEAVQLAAESQAAGIRDEQDVELKMVEAARAALTGARQAADKSLQEIAPSAPSRRRKRDLFGAGQSEEDASQVADLMGGLLAQLDRLEHLEEEQQEPAELEPIMLEPAQAELASETLGASDSGQSAAPAHSSAEDKRQRKSTRNGDKEMELWVDHRGCFNEPASQEKCGSCYNFAATAVLEYHYCLATGKRVKLSEQLPLDCHEAYGCGGGFPWEVVAFAVAHGVERAATYPYFARRKKCPFGKPLAQDRVPGFWRLEGLAQRRVLLADFEEALERGPLLVQVALTDSFSAYGGGVDEPRGCVKGDQLHAMVLVGHGRAGKRDFWLLRNSHSSAWGERGHWRVSKRAFAECYEDDEDNGFLVEGAIRFRRNRAYDQKLLEELSEKWHKRLAEKGAKAAAAAA